MDLRRYLGTIAILLACSASHAASLSFGLNANNVGFDPVLDYATVTISNNPLDADNIDFRVELNHAYFDAGYNFGLQAFYFNSETDIAGVSLSGMPGWQLSRNFGTDPDAGFQASEFGRFNLRYASIGYSRADPLAFTLSHPDDSLLGYALDNPQGFAFSAHITGYDNGLGGTSGWFGTPIAQTPVPAAVWLFGTALVGLIGIARRRGV